MRVRAGLSIRDVARSVALSYEALRTLELELVPPPRPSHPAWLALAELYGVEVTSLQRAARRDRTCLAEGIAWRRWRASK